MSLNFFAPTRAFSHALIFSFSATDGCLPNFKTASCCASAQQALSLRLFQHRTQICTGDHAGVTAQPAGLDVGLGRNVLCLALGQHCIADLQRDGGVGDINGNGIPFLDQADGAAGGRLRADVTDSGATGCAGEAAVRDEGHCLIQLHACQRRGGVEHLPHARAALGAFVADDHHIARDDLARVDGGDGFLLAVEHPRRAGMLLHLRGDSAALDNAAVRGNVAPQDLQTAGLRVGVLDGTDGLFVQDMGTLDILAKGLAGDGGHVQVQQALLGQLRLYCRDAARCVQIRHVGGACRCQMAQVGGLGADLVEQLQVDGHTGLVGDGQQVQHRVGGAAQRHITGQCVADGALVDDLARGANGSSEVYRTLDEIKESGTINIGVFSDKNPFGYVDENGEYQGYDIYFANRLGEDLGVDVNFVSTEAANRIEYLQTGKVDIILANFTVTDERAEEVDFALPYMNVALGVVSPDSKVIESLDDWDSNDQMIVISGTTAETYMIDNYPDIPLQKYDSYATAKNALENGSGAAWVNDNTEVIAYALQNTGYTVGIPSLGSNDTIAPAVSKGNTTLLDWINDEIKTLGEEQFFHADYEATLVDTYGSDYEESLVVEGGVTE